VESVVGRGTAFEVILPVAATSAASEKPAAEPAKPTILVADDEEVVRETARLALQRDGFNVLLAEDGQEAVRAVERDSVISLVLLDLTMPVLSGRGALERIRALRPAIPIVLFSGYNESDAMRQINDGDVAGFLKKPFTTDALRAKVSGVLKRSRRAVAG
jgi:CheY-like chemotaxis protein